MNKKISNPFRHYEGYNCFGCSPNNPFGLHMEFFEDGDDVIATWTPSPNYQGWYNVLHGGIQSTLMDEIASWVVFVKLKTSGVTSQLEIKYKKAVPSNKGAISIRAHLVEMKRNIAVVDVKLYSPENELCTIATVKYFTFSQEVAKEKLWYPAPELFHETDEADIRDHNCCTSISKK
ncbi:MAG: PaaI family thioesterase [Bacteroidota bacterium]|nr:PaaI family thioesterase [Bacteroidota bacterium]